VLRPVPFHTSLVGGSFRAARALNDSKQRKLSFLFHDREVPYPLIILSSQILVAARRATLRWLRVYLDRLKLNAKSIN
jgi:hypothetical protein